MNFIKRYFLNRREKKRLWESVLVMGAEHRATLKIFHEMTASIGIDRLEEMVKEAKANGRSYISLAGLYIDELQKRRNNQ